MAKATEVSEGTQIEMGKPYLCQECKRNHTKGKIYKDHLKYAKAIISDEEGGEFEKETLIKDLDENVDEGELKEAEFDDDNNYEDIDIEEGVDKVDDED
ncbi:MAG: hypothetical protein ACFFKA_12775, partial [Candidatus Thorarchaeota archaeon]